MNVICGQQTQSQKPAGRNKSDRTFLRIKLTQIKNNNVLDGGLIEPNY